MNGRAVAEFGKINTLSELLSESIFHFRWMLFDKKYRPHAEEWHRPPRHPANRFPEHCLACFAGSIIAKKFEVHHRRSSGPDDYYREVRDRLMAVEHIRSGNWIRASELIGAAPIDFDRLPKRTYYTTDGIARKTPRPPYFHFTDRKSAKKFLAYMEDVVLPAILKEERKNCHA